MSMDPQLQQSLQEAKQDLKRIFKFFTKESTPASDWRGSIYWAIAITVILGPLAIVGFVYGAPLAGLAVLGAVIWFGFIYGPPFVPMMTIFYGPRGPHRHR